MPDYKLVWIIAELPGHCIIEGGDHEEINHHNNIKVIWGAQFIKKKTPNHHINNEILAY